MAKHKDFDKYASQVFGGAFGKKRSSLTTVDVDTTPPPPFEVVVNIKNETETSPDPKLREDVSLSFPPSLFGSPVRRNHRKILDGLPEEDYSFGDADTLSDTDLECFCVDHMKLCSSRCAAEEHRHCNEVIPHFKRSARSSPDSGRGSGSSMFDSARQKYYMSAMEKLYNYAGIIIEDRMELRQYLCMRREDIMEQLYMLMEDLITQILKMKTAFQAKMDDFHEKNIQRLTEQTSRCHRLRHESRLCWQNLQTSKHAQSHEDYKEIVSKGTQKGTVLEEILKREYDIWQQLDYEFCPNQGLTELFDISDIAHIETKLETSKLTQFLHSEDNTEQDHIPNSELTIVSVLEEQDLHGKADSCFTGCAYATHENLVMTDWNNGSVKMFNKYGILMDKLGFTNCPWDVTRSDIGEVAVTVPKDMSVYFIDCNEHLKTISSFPTHSECFGIVKMGQTFVITCDPWSNASSVKVFSLSGQQLANYQYNRTGGLLFKCPLHVCTDYFEKVIYVSDSSADAVYAINLNGDLKFTYENFELRYPTGVKTDRFNRLYVCAKGTSNIHKISEKGEFLDFFAKQTDGIDKPTAICFNPDGGNIVFTDLQSSTCNAFLTKTLEPK